MNFKGVNGPRGPELQAVREYLSEDRFRPYLEASRGDAVKASSLYAWNTAASAALYGPLQVVEVTLRNAVHARLTTRFGVDWFDRLDATLAVGCLDRISAAKRKVRGQIGAKTAGQVVASLPFGFWVSLLGPGGRRPDGRRANYEMVLWRPCLRPVFQHQEALSRKRAHAELDALRKLRNRVAHHEPVFRRDLKADHLRILTVLGWISPEAADWVQRHSRLGDVLDADRTQFIAW